MPDPQSPEFKVNQLPVTSTSTLLGLLDHLPQLPQSQSESSYIEELEFIPVDAVRLIPSLLDPRLEVMGREEAIPIGDDGDSEMSLGFMSSEDAAEGGSVQTQFVLEALSAQSYQLLFGSTKTVQPQLRLVYNPSGHMANIFAELNNPNQNDLLQRRLQLAQTLYSKIQTNPDFVTTNTSVITSLGTLLDFSRHTPQYLAEFRTSRLQKLQAIRERISQYQEQVDVWRPPESNKTQGPENYNQVRQSLRNIDGSTAEDLVKRAHGSDYLAAEAALAWIATHRNQVLSAFDLAKEFVGHMEGLEREGYLINHRLDPGPVTGSVNTWRAMIQLDGAIQPPDYEIISGGQVQASVYDLISPNTHEVEVRLSSKGKDAPIDIRIHNRRHPISQSQLQQIIQRLSNSSDTDPFCQKAAESFRDANTTPETLSKALQKFIQNAASSYLSRLRFYRDSRVSYDEQ